MALSRAAAAWRWMTRSACRRRYRRSSRRIQIASTTQAIRGGGEPAPHADPDRRALTAPSWTQAPPPLIPRGATVLAQPLLAGNTVGLLPTQDLSKLAGAQAFQTAYQSAYRARRSRRRARSRTTRRWSRSTRSSRWIAAQKTPTRAAVLGAVAATKYAGVTGQIAFDKNGDPRDAARFSVYTCDTKGACSHQTSIAVKAPASS